MNKYDESNQRQSITRGLLVVIVSIATALSIGVLIGLSSNLSLNLVVSLSVAFGCIVGLWAALKGKIRQRIWKIYERIEWIIPR